jgi:cysteine desulfurase/selenocysteine lyase
MEAATMQRVDQADDISRWRSEFAVTESYIYLDHAGVGPTPQRTLQALSDSFQRQARRGSLEHPWLHEQAEEARHDYAMFIGARADQIGHVGSTSAGISLVAAGLSWQAGDEVVVPAIDFPSAVLPWVMLEPRGVIIRRVPCEDGRVEIDRLLDACNARTRVMCVSWVQFSSGFKLDLQRLGEACRKRGIFLIVDAIQGVGALQINVAALPIDALVTHSYKWLVGPQGVGWLYVADTLSDHLGLSAAGLRTVGPRESYFDHRFDMNRTVARFETGILNFHGIVGARASLSLLRDVGTDAIENRIHELIARIFAGLQTLGYEVKGGADRAQFQSGILAFNHPRYDAVACREALLREGIVTSAREEYVRVAPHFYTSFADVDTFLTRLSEL